MAVESMSHSVTQPAQSREAMPAAAEKPARLTSLDAYRGFIMLAMASAGLGLGQVAKKFPGTAWEMAAHQVDHAAWIGCTFWDLIQPSFIFMVGVAMPYSYAGRRQRGDSYRSMLGHAVVRSFILVALGVFLSSNWDKQTNFIFTNVLCQIGLGYALVFLLMGRGWRKQLLALAAILIGTWLLFYCYPVPDSTFDYAKAGITAKELESGQIILSGTAAHWSKSVNIAADFDRHFLNLFPRKEPYEFNKGGYQTLNFIPSMATMILGLMAGEMLRSAGGQRRKLLWLIAAGALCLALGLATGLTICPIIKRLWTPSWVLCSGAAAFWFLAAFYGVVEMLGYRRWTFPLVVVGMNSIVMYVMSQLMKPWVVSTLKIHLGGVDPVDHWIGPVHLRNPLVPEMLSGPYGPIFQMTGVLLVFWLICWWLYRQKIFVRI